MIKAKVFKILMALNCKIVSILLALIRTISLILAVLVLVVVPLGWLWMIFFSKEPMVILVGVICIVVALSNVEERYKK